MERDAKVYLGSYGFLDKGDFIWRQMISSGCSAIVYEDELAKDNTVSGYQASLRVSSGGTAVNNSIYAYMYVSNGGSADKNTICGGQLSVFNGGDGVSLSASPS